jgi:hypothetical protein
MLAAGAALLLAMTASAGGRLTATGGVSDLDGAGGGGLVPWALITGNGTEDEIGGQVHATHIDISHFRLDSSGVGIGINDRIELSCSRLSLGLGSTVPGDTVREDVLGIKWRVAGDAVFAPDQLLPQIALGVEYKHNLDANPVPRALGARRDADFDYYVATTKLVFAAVAGRNVLWNLTLRATRANQMGLLGFGGDLNDRYRVEPEASLGVFLRDDLVAGVEYKRKPDNLSAFRESAFRDAFLVWLPTKQLALTTAWAQLGTIANQRNEYGFYLGVQLND